MTTHKPRSCLQCDDGTMLEYGMRDIIETLEGEPIYVPNVEAWHCPVCGEIEFARDNDGADRYSQALDAAQEKLQARKARELRSARKALGCRRSARMSTEKPNPTNPPCCCCGCCTNTRIYWTKCALKRREKCRKRLTR